MQSTILFAAGNPFIISYVESDWFGKGIFWGLFFLSIFSWIIIIHKLWVYTRMRKLSTEFAALFSEKDPLGLQFNRSPMKRMLEIPHPFFEIYKALKQKTLQIINRNHFFAPDSNTISLSEADLQLIESQVQTAMGSAVKTLEKYLFVLPTVMALGPFLGLLGTVWGILLTLSDLHTRGLATGNAAMLANLSMALATTVIGLVVAIPALVGYNYLKNAGREFRWDMENFSQLLLTTVELQYRKPDHAQKVSIPP